MLQRFCLVIIYRTPSGKPESKMWTISVRIAISNYKERSLACDVLNKFSLALPHEMILPQVVHGIGLLVVICGTDQSRWDMFSINNIPM